jgi:hypothetical protein
VGPQPDSTISSRNWGHPFATAAAGPWDRRHGSFGVWPAPHWPDGPRDPLGLRLDDRGGSRARSAAGMGITGTGTLFNRPDDHRHGDILQTGTGTFFNHSGTGTGTLFNHRDGWVIWRTLSLPGRAVHRRSTKSPGIRSGPAWPPDPRASGPSFLIRAHPWFKTPTARPGPRSRRGRSHPGPIGRPSRRDRPGPGRDRMPCRIGRPSLESDRPSRVLGGAIPRRSGRPNVASAV